MNGERWASFLWFCRHIPRDGGLVKVKCTFEPIKLALISTFYAAWISYKYSYSPSEWDASQLQGHPRHSSLNLSVLIYTPVWRDWELSAVAKNTTQCPHLGLEPRYGHGQIRYLWCACTAPSLVFYQWQLTGLKAYHSHSLSCLFSSLEIPWVVKCWEQLGETPSNK